MEFFSLLLTQNPVPWTPVLVALVGGYLSGSVPYGLLLGKMAGIGDIRKSGSGNIGATNMLRVGGKKIAALTLLLDALKGAVPVLIAQQYHMDYAVMAALGAFVGHIFPVWLWFKGGKGVATGIGVLMALSWPTGLAICATWLAVAFTLRYSSLAALMALGLAPIYMSYFNGHLTLITAALFIAILVWIKHHANIIRLVRGAESKIGQKS